LRVLATP